MESSSVGASVHSLRTLGPPDLVGPDGQSAKSLRRKDLALLIYLVMTRASSTATDTLADLLWSADDRSPRHSLGGALGRIGALFAGPVLVRSRGTVRWAGKIQCDAVDLLNASAGDDQTVFPSTPTGSFCAPFHLGRGAEEFEFWAESLRPRIVRAAQGVWLRVLHAAIQHEDAGKITELGQLALRLEEGWVDGQVRVIEALLGIGARQAAMSYYEAYTRRMEARDGTLPTWLQGHIKSAILGAETVDSGKREAVAMTSLPSTHSAVRRKLFTIFFASPMSGWATDEEYQLSRSEDLTTIDAIRALTGVDGLFYAGETRPDKTHFEDEAEALKGNLEELRRCDLFVLHYPAFIATSALIEAGVALAIDKPLVILFRSRNDLPFLLRNAPSAFPHVLLYRYPNELALLTFLQSGFQDFINKLQGPR